MSFSIQTLKNQFRKNSSHHPQHPDNSNTPISPTEQPSSEKFFESNAGDGTIVYDHYLSGIRLIVCFLSCFLTLFLIGLDQTIIFTILETLAEIFGDHDKIGWISTAYMLPMAVLAATWGRISILFGRKESLLVAIVIFEIGSLVCALAPNMNSLIGGRVIAGIGAGGIQTLVFIVVTEMVPINKRPMVFAFLACAFSISSVTGPLIGGAFTENVTWRWCFYINLPIAGLAVIALFIFLNPPKPKGSWKEKVLLFDYVGTFLLACAIVLILLAMSFGGTDFPWRSAAVILMFILGGLMTILFCVWNFKYSKLPTIAWAVIKVPHVDYAVISLFTCFYSFMGCSIYLTTYFQTLQGSDALHTGLHLLPMIIGAVVASISSGILIKKTRYIKPFAVVGSIIGSVGLGILTLLKIDSSRSAKIGLLILPGVANGLILQASLMSAQLNAPKTEGGTILTTALFNFARSLGGALGGTLSQTVFNSTYKNKLNKAFESYSSYFDTLTDATRADLFSSPSSYTSLTDEKGQFMVKKAIMSSITNVFIVATSFSTLTVILCLLYSNKRLPERKNIMTREDVKPQQESNPAPAESSTEEMETHVTEELEKQLTESESVDRLSALSKDHINEAPNDNESTMRNQQLSSQV